MTSIDPKTDLQPKWDGDFLNRKPTADFLAQYVTNSWGKSSKAGIGSGLVIALDAGWGAGKSFFLDHWTKDLELNHPVVSFDAWKNDFTPDPLLGFLAELRKDLQPHFQKTPAAKKAWAALLRQARLAIKPAMVIAAGAALKAGTGLSREAIKEQLNLPTDSFNSSAITTVETVLDSKQLDKLFEELLKTHENRKDAIAGFRQSLQILVEQIAEDPNLHLPMFVMVDELDRCRPTYAIELLEGIKHLFGVPGVCFVVATNLDQLAESAKAIYGNGFDANQYLKKFFDLHYQLPQPNEREFIKQLLVTTGLDGDPRLAPCLDSRSYQGIDKVVELFFLQSKMFELTLRDQQQVMRVIEATANSLDGAKIFCPYLFFLAMLRHRSSTDYDNWISGSEQKSKATFQDVIKRQVLNPVKVKSLSRSGHPQEPPTAKETAITDVIWLFHKASFDNLTELRDSAHEINTHDYPNSLLQQIAEEAPHSYNPREFYASSLSKYPGLVRHAGQIIER